MIQYSPVEQKSTLSLTAEKRDKTVSKTASLVEDAAPTLRMEHLKNSLCILLNIASAVGIVMANKLVFTRYHFTFGTVLTVIHFLVTSIALSLLARLGFFHPKPLPVTAVIPLAASFCGFVVLTNLSLQFNSVGFYQMVKVMTTPLVVLIQTAFYGQPTKPSVQVTLGATCIGVLIATATEVNLTWTGLAVASVAVLVTAVYQVWIGTKHKELDVNAMQLLYYQAPISAVMLALFCPLFDDMTRLRQYGWNVENMTAITTSALLAVLVNISTFLIIGRTSAVTYNVVGHCKLSLVLLCGYLFFDSTLNLLNLTGVFVALTGICSYSYVTLQRASKHSESKM